jgi:hypothetical protein
MGPEQLRDLLDRIGETPAIVLGADHPGAAITAARIEEPAARWKAAVRDADQAYAAWREHRTAVTYHAYRAATERADAAAAALAALIRPPGVPPAAEAL